MQSSLRFPDMGDTSPNMGDNNSLSLGGCQSQCLILKNEIAGSLPPSTMRWVRDRERSNPLQSYSSFTSGAQRTISATQSSSRNNAVATLGCHMLRRRTGAGANRERMLQKITNRLYQQLAPADFSDVGLEHGYGAIFNLEFSPTGEVLVAACEGRSMLLYDPISMKHIGTVPNAHTDCINTFRFLDSRTFASGSDDTTVALWDIRNLKGRIQTLRGHSNWVKSIEYCSRDGLLVTSAFDGNVYTWDINRYEEEGPSFNRVFHIESLMRTRLTPDSTKLVMSTDVGFYIVIHDLDLTTLNSDLQGFNPMEYYDAMTDDAEDNQLQTNSFNRVFHSQRNRVELVMDFPPDSFPWSISSLVIHPQGWCMMSRYTTENENYEFTCVHDLQSSRPVPPSEDSHDALVNNGESSRPVPPSEDPLVNDDERTADDSTSNESIESNTPPSPPFSPTNRLLYHITEPNDGRGYIKELSVSPDGRLLCSSFGHGVRLLSFDQNCSELCDVYPSQPKELCHLKLIVCHRHTVLTSRFSPTHCLLATGCLNGKVVFHQPRL